MMIANVNINTADEYIRNAEKLKNSWFSRR